MSCLVPLMVFIPKNSDSIAMLHMICRPSFKCLMLHWQTCSPASHQGVPRRAGAGWLPSEADYKSLKRWGNKWWRKKKGEGVRLVWARPPEGATGEGEMTETHGGRQRDQEKWQWTIKDRKENRKPKHYGVESEEREAVETNGVIWRWNKYGREERGSKSRWNGAKDQRYLSGGEKERRQKWSERDWKMHFFFRTSRLTFTFRPDLVKLLPWAYPTDHMSFPPKVIGKKRKK